MDVPGQASTNPPAIVIGLDCITGLQTTRILARHGVPVIAIATDPDHFCAKTRLCQQIYGSNTKSEAFIDLLASLGPSFEHKPVLFPCTDFSVLMLSRNRALLSQWYHFALPPAEAVEMLMDKIRFYTYAEQEGLPIPGTFFLRNRADAERAAQQLSFPCILKPPVKTPAWEKNTKLKVYKVQNAGELLSVYDRACEWSELLMAQEWIEGTDENLYSCNCYFDRAGIPQATFIARKLRQWPPETGTSCLGEEVRNDEVLEVSLQLFKGVGYRGLGYVEMKRDERTGKSYIIEPNIGRPTGRSAIAEAGGVELLYTMYCDLLGRDLPLDREQTYQGVKWIYWRHDVQSALHYLRKGQLTLPGLLRSWRGRKTTAVFSWQDPAPFWYDLLRQVQRVLRKPLARMKQRRSPLESQQKLPL